MSKYIWYCNLLLLLFFVGLVAARDLRSVPKEESSTTCALFRKVC